MFHSMMKSLVMMSAMCAVMQVSVAAEPMLTDRHVSRGLKCEMCHQGGTPGAVPQQTCLKCHGGSYDALAAKTDKADINPHDTHLGEAECSQCHSGHKKPQLVCDQCHEFKMKVR